ncbi:hypothetical protein Dsin_015303 [Dipteronia sinensis]|uniref:TF-B3 domain-containing protein n=1 Tax=Dipteronia sinensis TaxID=43782 RepID=A0AAE0AC81_9ROSI|nr:hypothetical protein Dsin_015303 [Dipteronia sinensis]
MAHTPDFTNKITLTEVDVQPGRDYVTLNKEEVEEHIFIHWPDYIITSATIDDIKIFIKDVDTKSNHEVNFRCYGDACIFQGLWGYNFIQRRSLRAGDQIGICYDLTFGVMCFSVLMRNYL